MGGMRLRRHSTRQQLVGRSVCLEAIIINIVFDLNIIFMSTVYTDADYNLIFRRKKTVPSLVQHSVLV